MTSVGERVLICVGEGVAKLLLLQLNSLSARYSSSGVFGSYQQLQVSYHQSLDNPDLHDARETNMDYSQTCDLANRDAYMWQSVNESVLNQIWILSGYETLEIPSVNGVKVQNFVPLTHLPKKFSGTITTSLYFFLCFIILTITRGCL